MGPKNIEQMTVGELLRLFPEGFSISAAGTVQKVIYASSHFVAVASEHPIAPPNGGYLVVEMVEDSELS